MFEKQTLNKMIRQEIAMMEKLQMDMAATQQQVLDTLGKLTETTQQLKVDLDNEKIELKGETHDFIEETNKSIQNKMAIRTFAADLGKMKEPTVAFRSKNLADLTPGSREALVCKTTTLNEGLGYDNKTGIIFTAPVAGTYTFSEQLHVTPGNNMYYAIIADSVEINKGLFADETYIKIYITKTVAVLQKDSQVNVKCFSSPG